MEGRRPRRPLLDPIAGKGRVRTPSLRSGFCVDPRINSTLSSAADDRQERRTIAWRDHHAAAAPNRAGCELGLGSPRQRCAPDAGAPPPPDELAARALRPHRPRQGDRLRRHLAAGRSRAGCPLERRADNAAARTPGGRSDHSTFCRRGLRRAARARPDRGGRRRPRWPDHGSRIPAGVGRPTARPCRRLRRRLQNSASGSALCLFGSLGLACRH